MKELIKTVTRSDAFADAGASFTRVVQREARNPEFERMLQTAQYNLELRLAQQAAALERIERRHERELGERDARHAADLAAAKALRDTQGSAASSVVSGGEVPPLAGAGPSGGDTQADGGNGKK